MTTPFNDIFCNGEAHINVRQTSGEIVTDGRASGRQIDGLDEISDAPDSLNQQGTSNVTPEHNLIHQPPQSIRRFAFCRSTHPDTQLVLGK